MFLPVGRFLRSVAASTVVRTRSGFSGCEIMLSKAIGSVPGFRWKLGTSIYMGCCAIPIKIGSEDL